MGLIAGVDGSEAGPEPGGTSSSLPGRATLPAHLAPWFQEYDFAALDPARDATLIIERVLAYGTRADLRWLLARFGRPAVRAWLQELGHRRLPRRRYTLWCLLFDVPEQPRASPIWPH
jgi:hypothetical protein